MIVGKGIIELFINPEGGPGGTGYRRLRFQELGVMDEAKETIVMFQLFAVEVAVITVGFAACQRFMLL